MPVYDILIRVPLMILEIFGNMKIKKNIDI
jgi:hypothetical protein